MAIICFFLGLLPTTSLHRAATDWRHGLELKFSSTHRQKPSQAPARALAPPCGPVLACAPYCTYKVVVVFMAAPLETAEVGLGSFFFFFCLFAGQTFWPVSLIRCCLLH